VKYGDFAEAYGGGWASRLHLVTMPACALTTPQLPACQKRTPIATTNDTKTQTLSATVQLPAMDATAAQAGANADSAVVALAAVAGTSGSQGDYTATSLSASGSWSASATGAFTYAYPIATPPSLGGSAPLVSLSYNSQAVDGETSARNAQASWIGDGWDYSPGFIEREYRPCGQDGIKDSGDECWEGYNAFLSLGSQNGELVRDADGRYHLPSDGGTKIERLTGAANGLWEGEYYKLTSTDGTAYYFGIGHTPGTTEDTSTHSAWGVPVYHPKSADPCHDAAKGADSQCDKPVGYRFNLDFVVDPHGNVQRYDYATESNYYNMGFGQVAASGDGGTMTSYVRAGRLTKISYGYQLADARAGNDPAARIVFTSAQRCVTSDTVCQASNLSDTTATNWPDVPYDIHCEADDKTSGDGDDMCHTGSPTFWSTYRLKTITTQVKASDSFRDVDSYTLDQQFPDGGGVIDPVTGNTENPDETGQQQAVMWLASIKHTGLDTTAGGTEPITLDPVTFRGIDIDNRVDGLTPGAPPLYRPRISSVHTETGESIAVTYASPQCSRINSTMPSSADTNTMACFPVYWSPPGAADPISDWFNKSLVTEIDDSDATKAGSPARVTKYSYGAAAWHRDDSDLTDDRYRTWNAFGGFRTVTTTSGTAPDPLTKTVTTYLQGMDGDYKADGTTRDVTVGGVRDSPWLAGVPLETDTYNTTASGQPVVAKSFTEAPSTAVVASRTRTAWTSKDPAPSELSTLPPLTARRVTASGGKSMSLLVDGSWRTTESTSQYDAYGRLTLSDDKGDLADPSQERCTRIDYAQAPAANPMMLAYPSEAITVSGPCGTTPGTHTTLSDKRLFYDGDGSTTDPGTFGVLGQPWPSDGSTPQTHSLGNLTAAQAIKSYDSDGEPVFQMTGALTYDAYGRVTTSLDGQGKATTTAYSPSTAVLPSKTTTVNPLGWTSTNTVDPARNLVTASTDANGRVTESTYDALGRRTAAWLPGRSKADHPDSPDRKFAYAIHGVGDNPDPSSVTSRTLREDGTYNVAVTIYDGLLQPRQTQTTTANNSAGRLVTSTTYDSLGRPHTAIDTYADPAHLVSTTLWAELENTVPSETVTAYDGLGRPVSDQLWANGAKLWEGTASYPGADETDSVPPKGGQSTATFTNARGQVTATQVKDTTPDQKLPAGRVIASGSSVASNSVRLTMQADGDLLLTGIATGAQLWHSGTAGHPGASATVRTDGNLIITSTTGAVLWTSNPAATGTTGAYLMVRDDASVQVYTSAGVSKWSTGTAGKAAAADVTTRYTYTPAGQVKSIADTAGNTWSYDYDLQGLTKSQTDPDAGTSTYDYDAYGELTSTTDARGQTLSYTYDILGRRIGEYDGPTATPAKQLAGWTFDTLPDGSSAKGLETASTRYVGGHDGDAYVQRIDSINTAYQPTSVSTIIPDSEGKLAGTYTSTAQYSPNVGELDQTNYGADGGLPAEGIGYGYDLQGLLVASGSDTTSYLDLALYTPLGQVVQSTFGDYGKQFRTAQTYDTATGRLDTNTVSLQAATNAPIDATTYGYDQAGNLQTVSDVQSTGSTVTGTDTQCFRYDGLGRLAEAWTDTQGITQPAEADTGQLAACATATPTPATIGGPAPYWQSYTYDLLGDRTQQVTHNTAGNALGNITQTATYPGMNGTAASTHPNLTTNVTTTGPSGTTTITPQYDAAGNTINRDTKIGTAAPTSQAFGYDAEGRTHTVGAKAGGTGSATYLYDADGGLLLQKSTANNILYLFGGAEQLTLDNAENTVSGLRYYTHPDGTTIVRSSTGKLTYHPTNPQHTAQLQVDASSLAVTRRSFDPYGAPRGTLPTVWADNRGYLGQPTDPTTGLDLLGARNYDATLGRFLSVDPVLEAGDPSQMGGYAYAGDDPVNGSDPTGLSALGSVLTSTPVADDGSYAYNMLKCGAAVCGPSAGITGYGDAADNAETEAAIRAGDVSFPGWLTKSLKFGSDIFGITGTYNCSMRPGWRNCLGAAATIAAWFVPPIKELEVGAKTPGILSKIGLSKLLGKFGLGKGKPKEPGREPAPAEPKTPETPEDLAAGKSPSDTKTRPDPDPTAPKDEAEPSHPTAGTHHEPEPKVGSKCSFAPDTPVLLDNGTTKPIADVTVGDTVQDADPTTGKHATSHKVTATWINHDSDLLDVTVQGGDGKPATLHTTANHPFWDATTHTWTPAGELKPGDTLTTASDTFVRVLALHATPGTANRYNLTVDQLHTYYVLAGSTPILVHNTNTGCPTSYALSLKTGAPKGSGANQAYQIRQVGSTEYHATGGGTQVWADGLDTNTSELLDAKYVGNPGRSPFVPGGKVPGFIQAKIDAKMGDEFSRYAAVINDPGNPLTGLRVITNMPGAVPYFQGLMQQYGVPGSVILSP
jgi:RHS repeat-associated protein